MKKNWNWHILEGWLPDLLLKKMLAITPFDDVNDEDTRMWPDGKHGLFFVKSVYNMMCNSSGIVDGNSWNTTWQLNTPERVRYFLWLLRHGRLMTNARKSRMTLGAPYCPFCSDVIETELHVFRDCSQCMALWLHVVGSQSRELFFNSNLQQWINLNLNGEIEGIGISNWPTFWATACHSLWKWRNKEAHEENYQRPMQPYIEISRYARDYNLDVKVDNIVTALPKMLVHIKWRPPGGIWVVLNTDGAIKDTCLAGCGGLIRGSSGEWLGGWVVLLNSWVVVMYWWLSFGVC